MFVCPNCGANINFDPGKQLLHCDFCDTDLSPDSVIQKDDAVESTYTESEADANSETGFKEYTTTIYTCKECGGEILTYDNTVATFCSYCGASTVLSGRIGKERAPEYIIPFKITKQQSAELYKKAVKKALFAPAYMKEDTVIEKFRGIYMPYWIYDFKENRPASLRGQEDHRSGDYIIHTHYDINTNVDAEYNGLAYDASSQFNDNLSEAIAPFDFNAAVPFNTTYMSGFYADAADTDAKLYQDQARAIVTADIYNNIARDPAVKKITLKTGSMSNLNPEKTESRLGYFPVWFLSCKNKDRITYAVVNGQTGEVATDIPIDFKKYLIVSLIATIPIFALLYLIPVIKPTTLIVFALLFSIISMIIVCSQKNKIYVRTFSLDDKGLLYRQQQAAGSGTPDTKAPQPQPQPQSQPKIKSSAGSDAFFSVLAVVGFLISLCAGGVGVVLYLCVIVPLITNARKNKSKKVVVDDSKVKAKAPGGEKFLLCLKPLIGAVIAIAIWLIAPISDEYYYIAALICMVGVLLSFFDMIKQHNELSTRKPPQFDKRGGDEA
ncbi:MAG: hypothetical protein IKI46_04685 [Lachnospiraceae bacterium]|nr:hypothetical protein [Lachnospiraceae bacterium]